jgi:hypothetical protein
MFPDRTFEIEYHKKNAEKFLAEKNYDMARLSYFKLVESVRQQNINTNGQLEDYLKQVEEAYANFVLIDPLYNNILKVILPLIREHPNILQTELYKLVADYRKEDVSYTLFFADKHGRIERIKKGRTYSLSTKEN